MSHKSRPGVMAHRLQKVLAYLVCPRCQISLFFRQDHLFCETCRSVFSLRNGKIYFHEPPQRTDELDSIKGWLKKSLGKWYYAIGVDVISPDFPFRFERVVARYVDPAHSIVVDVGSGNRRIHPDTINVDFFDYDEVDIVCDIFNLPFKPESIDAFISRSVLEHVRKPWQIVSSMKAQTKPGGYGLHAVPFLYPFHASPDDFQRWTHRGLCEYFLPWECLEVRSIAGPVSAFLAQWIEFLSILFSFGRERIQSSMYLLFCLILFPLKFMDIFFIPFKSFITLSLMILGVFRKPS